MSEIDRRFFIKALGAGTAVAILPASIQRALAIPANNATGTIMDVEHVVILMQENRSFDHYLGTLQGVRGFNDPRAVMLSTGNSVWHQPTGSGTDYVLPFHPTTPVTGTTTAPDMGTTFIEDLDHGWQGTHLAWNNGQWDQWVPNKTDTTMAYLTRKDIPFHYALADAFTICDGYHCSLMGPTDPNRYHMWTGWVGNDGQGGGPVVDNAEQGYWWSTYPEKLQAAGITCKVYQDVGTGLTAGGYWGWTSNPYIGNYGDTSLLYFFQYQNAARGSPLADIALKGTNISAGGTLFDAFAADVAAGKLPQVSWIVAPEGYCEHPNWIPNWGAYYVSKMLDALTAHPEVWSKTVFFLTYDENDGFFDHIVPPTPPMTQAQGISTVGTLNEIFDGTESPNVPAYIETGYIPGPYGLGVRVPMTVISPWSKGGYVNSQVFDHTSLIRFLEQRFGQGNPALIETNITAWRRTVSGDLTSCFNFATPNAVVIPPLPATTAYAPPTTAEIAAGTRFDDYVPVPPDTSAIPRQEPGIRRARALPYRPMVRAIADESAGRLTLEFGNHGPVGLAYHVRQAAGAAGPWTFTIAPHQTASNIWDLGTNGSSSEFDLAVYGPNGFYRHYQGSVGANEANLIIDTDHAMHDQTLRVRIHNAGSTDIQVMVKDVYSGMVTAETIRAGGDFSGDWDLAQNHNWYDLIVSVVGDRTFRQRLAGHLENGEDSYTDPAMGNPNPAVTATSIKSDIAAVV
jgi:phospholipase C